MILRLTVETEQHFDHSHKQARKRATSARDSYIPQDLKRELIVEARATRVVCKTTTTSFAIGKVWRSIQSIYTSSPPALNIFERILTKGPCFPHPGNRLLRRSYPAFCQPVCTQHIFPRRASDRSVRTANFSGRGALNLMHNISTYCHFFL